MKTLVIGATGYVGSAICKEFRNRGHEVWGLARNDQNVSRLDSANIPSVRGSLDDLNALKNIACNFEIIVFVPMIPFDAEPPILAALIDVCRGSDRQLMFASGTGVIAIASPDGTWNENTFAEDDPFPFPCAGSREKRIATEEMLKNAAQEGVRTTIVRPPWIWGNGGGILVWQLIDCARRTGEVCYLGPGLNLYTNCHVDDVAQAFALAAEKGTPGALYHTAAGEANIRTVAEAVAELVGCGTRSVDYKTVCEIWSQEWVDLIMAVNSRSRSTRARAELGWAPRHLDVIADIRSGSYKTAYEEAKKTNSDAYSWSSHGSS